MPSWIGQMTQLKFLSVRSNRMSGTLPTELGALTALTQVRFDGGNDFYGLLPELPFAQWASRGACYLEGISFTCPLPPNASLCHGEQAGPPTCETQVVFPSCSAGRIWNKSNVMCAAGSRCANTCLACSCGCVSCCDNCGCCPGCSNPKKYCPACCVPEPTPASCSGNSSNLTAPECKAWVALFNSAGGEHWINCTSNRWDPCGCSYCPHDHSCGRDCGVKCSKDGRHITYM
jgi:hypothetical protein